MSVGTVYITEEPDPDDPRLWSGRFSAHWEARVEPGYVDGPTGVSVDEAIAWGRGHADVVLIRLGGSEVHYSAGTTQPEPHEEFPVWPTGTTVRQRRRPPVLG
jgi:hypothetical protein